MRYKILETEEFGEWFDQETPKSQFQIEKRLLHIEESGHFGTLKQVTDFVWELKWKNGRRIYFAYLEEPDLLLLLGGNKNGQSQDIRESKKILKKYQESETEKRSKSERT